jgi:uncharacterized membrane protein
LTLKFLFLLGETTELRLSHLNVAPLILAVAIVAFSRAKMNFVYAVVFRIATTFLDHNVSEVVDDIGEFEASGGAVTRADSRHLKNP